MKTMQSGHKMEMVNGKYKYVHRMNMEKKLGRKLRPGEQVHHISGDPSDNRPSNLEVVTMAEHNRTDPRHHLGGRKRGT